MLELARADLGWAVTLLLLLFVLLVWVLRLAVQAGVERAVERKFREWEVRFTKLHERRLVVMEELFERLTTLKRSLDEASGIQRDLDDPAGLKHLVKAMEEGRKALRYFDARRFYLPTGVAAKVSELLKEMNQAHGYLAMWAERQANGRGFRTDRAEQSWDEIGRRGRAAVWEKLPPLIEEVEEEFRRIVGA